MPRRRPDAHAHSAMCFHHAYLGRFLKCSTDAQRHQPTLRQSLFCPCNPLLSVVARVIVCQARNVSPGKRQELEHLRFGRKCISRAEFRFCCRIPDVDATFQIQKRHVRLRKSPPEPVRKILPALARWKLEASCGKKVSCDGHSARGGNVWLFPDQHRTSPFCEMPQSAQRSQTNRGDGKRDKRQCYGEESNSWR